MTTSPPAMPKWIIYGFIASQAMIVGAFASLLLD
jgi:hypothetical protein